MSITVDEYKIAAINRQTEGVALSLALCTEHHYTYVQGAGAGFVDTTGNRFRCDGHEYENGMIVRLSMTSGTAPQPFTGGTDYYIVGVLRDGTGDWFQLALTSGGAAIDILTGPNSGYYFWNLHRLPITADASLNVISSFGHPFIDGERVIFENTGGGLPGGIVAGTNYYVVNSVAKTSFQVSETKGGAALDITGPGSGTNLCYAPELSAADDVAVWLNREVFSYGASSRQTWTGPTSTDVSGETTVLTITPSGFPVPCRYAYIFRTVAMVNQGDAYQDLGASNTVGISGRSFNVRYYFPT